MTTPHRPGAIQRAILATMREGARLYQEGDARWYWERDGDSRCHDVLRRACLGLLEHGHIYNDKTEEHPFWRSGVRWRFILTELGKRAAQETR